MLCSAVIVSVWFAFLRATLLLIIADKIVRTLFPVSFGNVPLQYNLDVACAQILMIEYAESYNFPYALG